MMAEGKRSMELRDLAQNLERITDAGNVKIENFVGFVPVPVGIAGPLKIRGSQTTNDSFSAPLVTCEQTVVASCSRGCKAFDRCGGIEFKVLGVGMSRAPALMFSYRSDATRFVEKLPDLDSLFAI